MNNARAIGLFRLAKRTSDPGVLWLIVTEFMVSEVGPTARQMEHAVWNQYLLASS